VTAGAGTAGVRSWLRRHAIDVRPLRHPAYRRLLIGMEVSQFGYQFAAVAVPVQMYALTRSSVWVGFLGLAGLVPLLVFALWGGAVADAMDRRRVLLAGSLLLWASTLALLAQALVGLRSPVLLLVLVAVQSVAFAVSMPTRGAIVPRLVDREEVAAFLRAVAADYEEALGAADVEAAEPAPAPPSEEDTPSTAERWAAAITERRAVDLVTEASRRLEEVAERERFVAEAEQRVAAQLRTVRTLLHDARLNVQLVIPA